MGTSSANNTRSHHTDQNGQYTNHALAALTTQVQNGNITYTDNATTHKTRINIEKSTNDNNGYFSPDINATGLHLKDCNLETTSGNANIDGNLTVTGNLEIENTATFGAGVTFIGTPTFTGSANVDGGLTVGGQVEFTNPSIKLTNLPTTKPSEQGQLWNDSGTLKIS